MNKVLLTTLAALCASFAAVSPLPAQSGNLIYNDGNGTPNAGSYAPGSSFTFSINLAFTPGGTIANLEGFSYWFQTSSPNPPFRFAITLRDFTGSSFTAPQTPSLAYPQSLTPSNSSDLGAVLPGNTGMGAGTYFVANITIAIDPAAAPGVYQIQNVISGGKTSFIFSDQGTAFAIPQANYALTVVPEPTTCALAGCGLIGLVIARVRKRAVRA